MRSSCRIDELLHAIGFGKTGGGGAAAFDGVEKYFRQPGYGCDASIGIFRVDRIVGRDPDHGGVAPDVPQLKTAHVVRARVMQDQCAVLAEKLDAMPDAAIRCTAHRERHQRADGKLQSYAHRSLQLTVAGQAGYARGQARDRSAEPLQIVEAVGNEIAQYSAAIVADGFPVAHAHLDGAALDMPMHGDMAQFANHIGVKHSLGSLPCDNLMKIEIDHRRLAAHGSLSEHGPRYAQIASKRLFG